MNKKNTTKAPLIHLELHAFPQRMLKRDENKCLSSSSVLCGATENEARGCYSHNIKALLVDVLHKDYSTCIISWSGGKLNYDSLQGVNLSLTTTLQQFMHFFFSQQAFIQLDASKPETLL